MADQLTPPQIEAFHQALLDAYNPSSFEMMLFMRLGKKVDQIASSGPFAMVLFEVIQVSMAQGWLMDLVYTSQAYVPRNRTLKTFVDGLPQPNAADEPNKDASDQIDMVELKDKMLGPNGINLDELRLIVSDLQIIAKEPTLNYDDLPGARSSKVLELIGFLNRRRKLGDLVDYLNKHYPHVLV